MMMTTTDGPPVLLLLIVNTLAPAALSVVPQRDEDIFNQPPTELIPLAEPSVAEDNRVILQPGQWKIRARDTKPTEIEYRFSLGSKWLEFQLNYPHCHQVACLGLREGRQKGCETICSITGWSEHVELLQKAKHAFNRAVSLLNGTFRELAALMEAHTLSPSIGIPDRDATILEKRTILDVMVDHRLLIEQVLANITEETQHLTEQLLHPTVSATNSFFDLVLDIWRSGVLRLAMLLSTATHVLQEARMQLLTCAHGVQLSDLACCHTRLISGFHTDTPVASHWQSTGRLALVARREAWTPVALSFWFMPFIDSSKGNRVCWLDRAMLNDSHLNYRVPECNSRGLCGPLEVDNKILTDCQVNRRGEIDLGCQVVCEGSCFGPICYNSKSAAYTARPVFADEKTHLTENDPSLFLVATKPRILTMAQSLSEADVHATHSNMSHQANQAVHLLQQGQSVLSDLTKVKSSAEKYIMQVKQKNRLNVMYATEQKEMRIIAAASLMLSVIACLMLLGLLIKSHKKRSCKNDYNIPVTRPKRHRTFTHDE